MSEENNRTITINDVEYNTENFTDNQKSILTQ